MTNRPRSCSAESVYETFQYVQNKGYPFVVIDVNTVAERSTN